MNTLDSISTLCEGAAVVDVTWWGERTIFNHEQNREVTSGQLFEWLQQSPYRSRRFAPGDPVRTFRAITRIHDLELRGIPDQCPIWLRCVVKITDFFRWLFDERLFVLRSRVRDGWVGRDGKPNLAAIALLFPTCPPGRRFLPSAYSQ